MTTTSEKHGRLTGATLDRRDRRQAAAGAPGRLRGGLTGAALAAALLAALAGLHGCGGPLTPQASQMLQDVHSRYEAGDYKAAIVAADTFLRDNAGSSRAAEAYYLRGLARKNTGNPAGAKADLAAALKKARTKELLLKACLAAGNLAYDVGDMALAENMYRKALPQIKPGKKPADHAYFRLGCVLQRQGRWEEADVQFDRAMYLFGDSRLGKLAGRRARCVAWTIQAGVFAGKARADTAAENLRRDDLPAEVSAELRDGQPVFVVQTGRFATYEQALAALPEVTRYHADAFVAPTR